MVTFPLLTPSDFRWEAPTYEQVSHTAEDGAIVRQILMDTPGQGRVEVEFQNCRDSDFEAVLAAHDATYGQWDALTLPDAFWEGRGAELRAVIEDYHPSLEWAFAEVPAADWAKKGRCTIRVTLKHRVRPLALTLAPGGTATPLVPKTDPGTPAVVDALPVLNCNIVIPPIVEGVGCQAFWALRLDSPVNSGVTGQGFYVETLVDVDGSLYAAYNYYPVGAADATIGTIVVLKTDKDGAVQWVRTSTAPRSRAPHTFRLKPNGGGVLLMVDRDAVSGGGTSHIALYWEINADGSLGPHTSYNPTNLDPCGFEVPTFHNGYVVAHYTDFSRWVETKYVSGVPVAQRENDPGNVKDAITLPNGNRLSVGNVGGVAWLAVTDSNLDIVEQYVYTGTTTGFEGIASYDANTFYAFQYYTTNPSTSRLVLISKSTYDIVAVYSYTTIGTQNDVRGLTDAVNGIITVSIRDNFLLVFDVPNLKVSVKRYEAVWYTQGTSPSGGLTATGISDFGNQDPRPVINVSANAAVAGFARSLIAGTRPELDKDRLLFLSAGLKLPEGVFQLPVHTPYESDYAQITVTATSAALTSVTPLPTKVVQASIVRTAVMGTARPEFLAPFVEPATGTHEWELSRVDICPPPLTTVLVSGPATVPSNTDERFFAAVIPDPAASVWPHTYAWSSPDAVFSSTSVYNPLVKWNLPIGQKRVLTLTVSNAGYSKTATLEVTIGAAVAQFNEDFF